MKKNVTVLVLAAILIGIALYQNRHDSSSDDTAAAAVAAKPKQPAPAFALEGLDGKTYGVGGKRDKPLMLNFWASWCGPCETEAPDLQQLYAKYGGKLDLYAVNITQNDAVDDVKVFVSGHGLTFPILLDRELEATKKYGVQGIPTSFLIDKNGVVVDVLNLMEPQELEKKLKRIIEG